MKNIKRNKMQIKKFILNGSEILLMLIIIGCTSFHGSNEITEYHPFRSSEAKQKYLKIYEERSKIWPVPYESIYSETSYGKTYVRVSGSKDAPTLVLLPGYGGNSLLWYKNIQALSEHFRTYAIDPTFEWGLSVYKKTMNNPDDYVAWLDELFTDLNLGNEINLMGLSYGGWLTSQYALKHQERLRKIVLVAPAATILKLRSGFYIRGFLMTILPFRYFKESFFRWLFGEMAQRGEEGKEFIRITVDQDEEDSKLFKSMPDITFPTVLNDSELKSFKIRVLFIIGENDIIYSAQDAVERIKNIAPDIKTEIIPKASHDLIFSQSELFNKAVIEFLK